VTPYDRYNASPKGIARRIRYRQTRQAILNTRRFNREYQQRNPDKHNSHNRVQYAMKTGKLVRQPCEIDAAHRGRVEAHHPFGYLGDLALAVWWLCKGHHVRMHQAIGGQ
jgi:hypothetical protein